MFIEKDDRLSQAAPSRRPDWGDDGRRRAPRNWQRLIRRTLYGLIGILAVLATLAGAALLLDRVQPAADTAALAPPQPAAPPQPVVPPQPPPAIAAEPPPAPMPAAPAAPSPADTAALQALQQQIREANAALAGLRTETEQLRQGLTDATHQHDAAAAAQAEHKAPPLAQRAPAPPPAPVAVAPHALPPASTPAPPPPAAFAANALPEASIAAPALPRPRVFVHYPAGEQAGMQTASDIAQRLLFSDFAYADTRSAANPPGGSMIRYFYAEDAPAADRLAALLGGPGMVFQVRDMTGQPGRAVRGTLEVWIGR